MSLYRFFGTPFGLLMKPIYALTQNYALAIILFTLITKIILLPISYKTQKNSARMQTLNPELAKLRKSYSNNKNKFQEEQMKLYQREGINPAGSCLPTLIQMLLLFGVLDVVYSPLTHILRFSKTVITNAKGIASDVLINAEIIKEKITQGDLRGELKVLQAFAEDRSKFEGLPDNFISKVADFSDNFNLFGINLGEIPKFRPEVWNWNSIGLFMIPFIAGLSQLIHSIYMSVYQKKNNPEMPKMAGMGVMTYAMPVMSVVFAFSFPAGMGFYWICTSIFSLLITIALNKYFTKERIEVMSEADRAKAKKYAAVHGEKKGFMQRMMEQQQTVQEEQRYYKENGEKMSKSEISANNRKMLNEARKRLAEKYGDIYDEEE